METRRNRIHLIEACKIVTEKDAISVSYTSSSKPGWKTEL